MKHHSLYCLLLFCFLAGVVCFAGCNENSHPLPKHAKPNDIEAIRIHGKLLTYQNNPVGDVDQMILLRGGENINIHFPPHTAQQVMAIAKPEEDIDVVVRVRKGPRGRSEHRFDLLSIKTINGSVTIQDIPPPPPQKGDEVSLSGQASELIADTNGNVHSFVLNKTLIVLPPHIEMNMSSGVSRAKNITVKGFRRKAGNGFVNSKDRDVVRPITITIDNITYTIE